jgi:hypothetical protein
MTWLTQLLLMFHYDFMCFDIGSLPDEFIFVNNNMMGRDRIMLSNNVQNLNLTVPQSNMWNLNIHIIQTLLDEAFGENRHETGVFMSRLMLSGIEERVSLTNSLAAPRIVHSGPVSHVSSLSGVTNQGTLNTGGVDDNSGRDTSISISTVRMTNDGSATSSLTERLQSPRTLEDSSREDTVITHDTATTEDSTHDTTTTEDSA